MRGAAAVVVALAVLVSGTAVAEPSADNDPNDTRGPLDIRRIERTSGTKYPRFSVRTYEAWSKRRIRDRGFVVVYVDSFGDRHFDYYALVRSDGRALRAALYRNRKQSRDYRIKSIPAAHPGRRAARVTIPFKALRKRETFFRWRVQTLWNGRGCPRVCFDRSPATEGVRDPFGR